MSIAILKTDSVNKCPGHILDPLHYHPDGSCPCATVKQLTLKEKELSALEHKCPVCNVEPGFSCLHQQSTRKMRRLKFPHPERIVLVDPDYIRKLPQFRQAGNSGKGSNAQMNTRYGSAGVGRKLSRKPESSR